MYQLFYHYECNLSTMDISFFPLLKIMIASSHIQRSLSFLFRARAYITIYGPVYTYKKVSFFNNSKYAKNPRYRKTWFWFGTFYKFKIYGIDTTKFSFFVNLWYISLQCFLCKKFLWEIWFFLLKLIMYCSTLQKC